MQRCHPDPQYQIVATRRFSSTDKPFQYVCGTRFSFYNSITVPDTVCPFSMNSTYSNQSIVRMIVMSSVGNPTAVKTITMVIRPACGTPAAPMAAAVAVILKNTEQLNTHIAYTHMRS